MCGRAYHDCSDSDSERSDGSVDDAREAADEARRKRALKYVQPEAIFACIESGSLVLLSAIGGSTGGPGGLGNPPVGYSPDVHQSV